MQDSSLNITYIFFFLILFMSMCVHAHARAYIRYLGGVVAGVVFGLVFTFGLFLDRVCVFQGSLEHLMIFLP